MTRRALISGGVLLAAAVLVTGAGLALMTVLSTMRSAGWSGEAHNLEQLLEGWVSLPSVPGAILHIQSGDQVIYSGAAGRVQKNRGPSLSPETPFHIGSVGKLFTAATVLRLHERGLLNIDDPAKKYLDPDVLQGLVVVEDRDYSGAITIRQLLSHRAGLGNTDESLSFLLAVLARPGKKWNPKELLAAARRAPAKGLPGQRGSYATPGYYLLGLVIERVAGKPYHEAVRTEIFDRLGMNTTYETNHEWKRGTEALHHYTGWVDLAAWYPGFGYADGGFVTTAQDMSIFGLAMARGALFDKQGTSDLFFAPPDPENREERFQALGPSVRKPRAEPWSADHYGYWGVYFIVYPGTETVAVMTLAQSNARTWQFWEAVRRLADLPG